jgi:hypothetical protein
VTITVSDPPPPYIPPPFTPVLSGSGSSGGSSSGGGGGGGGGGSDNQHVTGSCTYGSSGCPTPPVGCPPGGSNCSGSAGGGGGTARVALIGPVDIAKSKLLFKPMKFKLAAGKSKRLRLTLTKAAKKTLAKKKKLRFKVYVTLRKSNVVVRRYVFTMNVKAPKKKRR